MKKKIAIALMVLVGVFAASCGDYVYTDNGWVYNPPQPNLCPPEAEPCYQYPTQPPPQIPPIILPPVNTIP